MKVFPECSCRYCGANVAQMDVDRVENSIVAKHISSTG